MIERLYDAPNSYGGTIGEALGVDPGPLLTVTVTVVQLWFLAFAIWLLPRSRLVSTSAASVPPALRPSR